MDVDEVSKKGNMKKRETNAMDLATAKRLGVCYKCGEKGHMGKDCKNKPKTDATKSSSTSQKAPADKGKKKPKDFSRPQFRKIREIEVSDSEYDSDMEIQVVRKKATGTPTKPVKQIEAASMSQSSKSKKGKSKVTFKAPSGSSSPEAHISELDTDDEKDFRQHLL